MKIKFLRNVDAPRNYTHQLCHEACGCSETRSALATFLKDDVEDPNDPGHEIELKGLLFNVDYIIVEYP